MFNNIQFYNISEKWQLRTNGDVSKPTTISSIKVIQKIYKNS